MLIEASLLRVAQFGMGTLKAGKSTGMYACKGLASESAGSEAYHYPKYDQLAFHITLKLLTFRTEDYETLRIFFFSCSPFSFFWVGVGALD